MKDVVKARTSDAASGFARWVAWPLLVLAILVLCLGSFAQWQVRQRAGWVDVAWSVPSPRDIEASLARHLADETAANPNITGQILYIHAPNLGLTRTFAAGPGVRADDDVRVASNIKPFVAAAALRLVEQRKLALDGPIQGYLSQPVESLLRQGGVKADEITLRHLLNHTSGLADYGDAFAFQLLAYVPTAYGWAPHWTPEQQIWFAVHLTPRRPIGSQFRYSDTNYLIASDMIAKANGTQNRALALRQLLDWERLGAEETYWEQLEPTPPGTRRVRQFRGAIEDTHLDVSFDLYGGGGLVMSMQDLGQAHRAVVRGEVFDDPRIMLKEMQTPGGDANAGGYGLGLSPISAEGETCWSHGGRWGTIAIHCPVSDITIAKSWGQSNASGGDLLSMLSTLIRLSKSTAPNPKGP